MGKQQQKRRRKRHLPQQSAYAGDVKPPGIFALFSDIRLIRGVFILMAVGLVAGLFAVVFAPDILLGGGANTAADNSNFVLPDDDEAQDEDPSIGGEARQFESAPQVTIDPSKTYTATIHTELGDIEVELMPDQALEAVNSFVFLAREGFYDGLIFHYGDGTFSANAGDPACQATSASNCRGDGGPGYELSNDAAGEFQRGVLGLANGSQFFITLTESPTSLEQFEGFPAFGRVLSGLDVAEQVTAGTEIRSIEIFEN